MRIAIDAGHGPMTRGKQTVDGMKEYSFNSAAAEELSRLLQQYHNVQTLFTHHHSMDVPLAERAAAANRWKADLLISIHANAHGNGEAWNSANGIETFVHTSRPPAAVEAAKSIQKQLIFITNRRDRGVKAADYFLLRKTAMTAILCECGFMTNKTEAALLRTHSYRQDCARAICTGIAECYGLKPKNLSSC
ncbi:N-acetylmuramoyl-L-alanine amidase [Bacillus lacus]|uniref:N-acetylmuramoyl-L-alanine amidase n=1 Tax=Metabacillus lacus TaxID=1983721 RepID=A0A7X2M037_9BACI|nr:N-acetylmuramoyl-L-alanine amidase [Metabacillus lacus]MRX72349.1 N-acetylmuramoyl-L-alanine amidase [Metabacillus lacus]